MLKSVVVWTPTFTSAGLFQAFWWLWLADPYLVDPLSEAQNRVGVVMGGAGGLSFWLAMLGLFCSLLANSFRECLFAIAVNGLILASWKVFYSLQ